MLAPPVMALMMLPVRKKKVMGEYTQGRELCDSGISARWRARISEFPVKVLLVRICNTRSCKAEIKATRYIPHSSERFALRRHLGTSRMIPTDSGTARRFVDYTVKITLGEIAMLITSDNEPLGLERVRALIETFREVNPQMWSVSLPSDGPLMPSDLTEEGAGFGFEDD